MGYAGFRTELGLDRRETVESMGFYGCLRTKRRFLSRRLLLHSGASPAIMLAMPTKHRRISVTVDPSLSEAVERARRCAAENGGEREIADATLIHDLAIRGAGVLEEEEERRRRLIADLADPDWRREHLDLEGLKEVLALREADPTAPNL